jgi:hypothetical protein
VSLLIKHANIFIARLLGGAFQSANREIALDGIAGISAAYGEEAQS